MWHGCKYDDSPSNSQFIKVKPLHIRFLNLGQVHTNSAGLNVLIGTNRHPYLKKHFLDQIVIRIVL